MESELIIIQQLYDNTRIEPSFVELLYDEGLIDIEIVSGKQYIRESQIRNLEHFARLYYDLSINVEGIDVIHNLMLRMDEMKNEMARLRSFFDSHQSLWTDVE